MATNKGFLICVVCFVIWGYLVISEPNSRVNDIEVTGTELDSASLDSNVVDVDTLSPVQKANALYESYIGIREEGNNAGYYVNLWMDSVGLDNQAQVDATGAGFKYCAAFACYPLTVYGIDNPRTAWAATVANYNPIYNKGRNKFPSHVPKDKIYLFGVYFPELKRDAHTGKIWEIRRGAVKTIEGNTNRSGSRDGGGVESIIRPIGNINVISEYG